MTPVPDLPDLATAEPDAVVDGRRVFYIWHPDKAPVAPAIPSGVIVEHGNSRSDRPCISWIPWVDTGDGAHFWTLISLRPLSIVEPFVCTQCGAFGVIRDGHWYLGLPR